MWTHGYVNRIRPLVFRLALFLMSIELGIDGQIF